MKITLTKKVIAESGRKLPKGLTLDVVNEYGRELIEAGKAVEFGAEAPQNNEDQLNNLD